MAWVYYSFSDHTAPGYTNAQILADIKDFLKTLGWTVPRSGDAAGTYSSSGDVVDGGTLINTGAWYNLRSPDGLGEFSVQRGSSATTGRIKFCAGGDGFDDGTGDHDTTPGTTGSQLLAIGGGSDAVPTYANIALLTDNNTDLYIIANDESPWQFCAFGVNKSGIANQTAFSVFYDPIYDADDLDDAPGLLYWNAQGSSLYYTRSAATSTGPVGWIAKGLGGGLVRIPSAMLYDSGQRIVPELVGPSAYNSKTQIFPLRYARSTTSAAPNGEKGGSSMFGWCGSPIATIKTGTRLRNPDGDIQWVVVDDHVLPCPTGFVLDNDPSGGAIVDAEFRNYTIPGTSSGGTTPALDPTGTGFRRSGIRHVRQRRR